MLPAHQHVSWAGIRLRRIRCALDIVTVDLVVDFDT
jgi:hypothetical protein